MSLHLMKEMPFDMDVFAGIAREMFPEETRNMHFVDTSNPGHKSRIVDYINNVSPAVRDFFFKTRGGAEGYADSVMRVERNAEFKMDIASGQKIILMDVAGLRREKAAAGPGADHWLWGIAFHELGHGVVPHAAGDMLLHETEEDWLKKEKNWDTVARSHYAEISADSFSALMQLRAGMATPPDIQHDGFNRAYKSVWAGHTNYSTFMATNQIVIDAKTADFMTLSPREVKEIATRHAETFCRSPDDLKKAHAALNTIPDISNPPTPGTKEFAEASAKLIKNLDAPTDSIEFNASALLINRFMEHSLTRKYTKTPEWENAGRKLVQKAEALGMTSIMATFDAAARRRSNPVYAAIDAYREFDRKVEQKLMKVARKVLQTLQNKP